MRDLDQLQEQDPDLRRRSLATLSVLGIVLLGLFGSVFTVWSRAVPEELHSASSARARRAVLTERTGTAIDPSKLTFERALTSREERPEVLAALEAAAREEERSARKRSDPSRVQIHVQSGWRNGDSGPTNPIPASLAASSAGPKLERAARHDKLVAAAMTKSGRGAQHASPDSAGDYVLHVISYDNRSAAEALASALRDKGHNAFVAVSDVSGRGHSYRVRLGPFASRGAADAYRRVFEASERMNTIIVMTRDE